MSQPTQPTQPTQPQQPYGQRPPMPPPPIQPPAKRKRFGWLALILTGAICLVVGGAIGGSGDGTATTAAPAPTSTVTETVEAPGPEVTVTAQPPKATAKPKADTGGELGEGTYEVGKDVKAGRYKTTVPDDSSGCYWERTKDDSGNFDSIIANDNASPGAKVSVTIKNGEFFKNNGCGDWARQ